MWAKSCWRGWVTAMYNRYIRSDNGPYQRIPVQEAPPADESGPPPFQDGGYAPPPPPQGGGPGGPPPGGGQRRGFLSGILGRLKLDELDTSDLILLLLIFLLFREGEDEELLIALGLLFIL